MHNHHSVFFTLISLTKDTLFFTAIIGYVKNRRFLNFFQNYLMHEAGKAGWTDIVLLNILMEGPAADASRAG